MANEWLRRDCSSPNWCNKADLNHSGEVDLQDLRVFLDNWLDPFAEAPLWLDCWNVSTQCHGDADGSGRVTVADVYIFQGAAPIPAYYGDMRYNPCVDFDRDGDVDTADQNILTTNFGKIVSSDCPSGP